MSKLSENMKNMRLLRNLTIKEVASRIGCAPNTISNWEKGTISPNVDILQDLCGIYNISPNQLFGWEPCQELDDFIKEKRTIINELAKLQKEKADIEKRIRKYTKMLNQR